MSSLIAIVPARAGSKGLVNKNVKPFCGMSLIKVAVKEAIDSSIFQKIIVTTDSTEIKNLYRDNVNVELHNRSNETATDSAVMSEVILELITEFNLEDDTSIMLLQPTSPLRNAKHIIESYDFYMRKSFESLISVSLPFNNPADCFQYVSTFNESIDLYEFNTKNRQDYKKMAYINGSIYLIKVKNFLKYKSFYTKYTGLYWMSKKHSIDIDDKDDFELCELIWKQNQNLINR